MNKTLFALELMAILAAYLIISMPFTYAALWPKQVVPVQQPQLPTVGLTEIYTAITGWLIGLLDSVLPGVRAQSCPTGYYYDIGTLTCKSLAGITITHIGTEPISFEGCNQAHEANVTVRIANPPTGMTFETKAYYLNGSTTPAFISTCSMVSSNTYKCPITISAFGPNCREGVYTLDPNKIELNISFPDGQETAYKSLSTTFSSLTINSWVCGDGICQTSLGESSSNCCVDCACSTGICDWVLLTEWAEQSEPPSNASCRPEPTSLSITNKKDKQIAGGIWQSTFNVSIPNAPRSLTMIGNSVTVKSCDVERAGCTVTGVILSCDPSNSLPTACNLSFRIQDYNSEKMYNILFNVSFTVHYQNGSYTIEKTLSKTISSSPGRTYCGNLQVDAGETASTCCYDVGCGEGYYCDVSDDLRSAVAGGQAIPYGNLCRKIDDIKFGSIPIIETNAQTAEQPTQAGVEIKIGTKLAFDLVIPIENRPATISGLDFRCRWADSLANVGLVCNVKNCKIRGNELNCSIESNLVDFSLLEPSKNQEINGNNLTGTIVFNNGPGSITKAMSTQFTIKYQLKPTCGNGWCETAIGEGEWGSGVAYPCPADCGGCPGQSKTDTIQLGNERCVNPAEIQIYNYVFPDKINCTAAEVGNECALNDFDFAFAVQHPVGSEIELDINQKFEFSIDGQKNFIDTNCPSSPHQTIEQDGILLSGFGCSPRPVGLLTSNLIIPGLTDLVSQKRAELVAGQVLVNPIDTKTIDFNFPFKAYIDGQTVDLSFSKTVTLEINLEENVISCSEAYNKALKEHEATKDLKDRYKNWANIAIWLGWILLGAAAIFAALGWADWAIGAASLATLFFIINEIANYYLKEEISDIEYALETINSALEACNAVKDIKQELEKLREKKEDTLREAKKIASKIKTARWLFGGAAAIGMLPKLAGGGEAKEVIFILLSKGGLPA